MASGRDTREYTSVLRQMTTITDYLKVNNGSRDTLIQKYQQEQWMPILERPDANGLVTIALNRISMDARQYDVFIKMLKGIAGMDIIVEKIKGIGVKVIPSVVWRYVCNIVLYNILWC